MTCIHLQAELNKEAINTYTLRLRPRTPRIEKTHLLPQYSVSLRYTSPVLLVEGLPTLRETNDDLLSFSSSSLRSSRNRTRSPIAVTPSCSIFSLLIDWTIEGTITSCRNPAASVLRFSSVKMSPIFSHSTKQYTECFLGAWWRS